jgi:ribosomal-protein-alanine N-acetyltransferase
MTAVDAGPETIAVTPMRRRHLRQVLRIEAHNTHRPWSLGLFMSELRQPEGRVYAVALDRGRVVGFAGELFAATDAHVTTIAVHPDHRRKGVATALMLLLARQAVDRGMTALTLEVAASNRGAQALYHRFGLAPVGVRKNYYEDLKEDAVIMWAHDLDGDDYRRRLDDIAADGSTRFDGWPAVTEPTP